PARCALSVTPKAPFADSPKPRPLPLAPIDPWSLRVPLAVPLTVPLTVPVAAPVACPSPSPPPSPPPAPAPAPAPPFCARSGIAASIAIKPAYIQTCLHFILRSPSLIISTRIKPFLVACEYGHQL